MYSKCRPYRMPEQRDKVVLLNNIVQSLMYRIYKPYRKPEQTDKVVLLSYNTLTIL